MGIGCWKGMGGRYEVKAHGSRLTAHGGKLGTWMLERNGYKV
jgi:hypothetical protein